MALGARHLLNTPHFIIDDQSFILLQTVLSSTRMFYLVSNTKELSKCQSTDFTGRIPECARMCFHSKTLLLNTTSYLSNPTGSTRLIACVGVGKPWSTIRRHALCTSKCILFWPLFLCISSTFRCMRWAIIIFLNMKLYVTLHCVFLWHPQLNINLSKIQVPCHLCCLYAT